MLKELLKEIATVHLIIASTSASKDANGNTIAIFELEEALPYVRGSQSVTVGGKVVNVSKTNCTTVKLHADDMDVLDGAFTKKADGTLEYKSDIAILDVAKGSGEVWLRTQPFSASAASYRNETRENRYANMLGLEIPNPDAAVQAPNPAAGAQRPEAVTS